jgi:hypothetical protein
VQRVGITTSLTVHQQVNKDASRFGLHRRSSRKVTQVKVKDGRHCVHSVLHALHLTETLHRPFNVTLGLFINMGVKKCSYVKQDIRDDDSVCGDDNNGDKR